MANGTFRASAVYTNGQKVAEAQTSTFSVKNGGTTQHGIDGVLGVSDGTEEVTCEIDSICPVAGFEIAFLDLLHGRAYCTIGYAVDGKLLQSTGKIQAIDYSSDSKTGEVKGKISFMGDAVKIT